MQFFHILNYTTVRNSTQLKTAFFRRRLKIFFHKIFTTSRLCELVWSSDNHRTLPLWRCSLRFSHFFQIFKTSDLGFLTLKSSLSRSGYLRILCTGLISRAPKSNTTVFCLSRSNIRLMYTITNSLSSYLNKNYIILRNM